jgi:hypothetical protein
MRGDLVRADEVKLAPYRGAAPAMQDLLAGQIDLVFSTPDVLVLAIMPSLNVVAAQIS